MKSTVQRFMKSALGNNPAAGIRKRGDAARDARNWIGAEQAYREYLEQRPENAAIWVQYGHSLKEQGKLGEAEAAYRRALAIAPGDADGHLQLGHVLKLQARVDEAAEAYADSLRLSPTKAATDELESLGRGSETVELLRKHGGRNEAADLIYFELDDLIGWLRTHSTLSGIQRVQAGIAAHIIALIGRGDGRYAFIRRRPDTETLLRLDPSALGVLIAYCTGSRPDRARIQLLLDQLEDGAVPVQPARGQCYFILGSFWGFSDDLARYTKLKELGVSVGAYIYDLIPVTHPEHCDAELVNDFALALGDGLAVFDFILTISEFTAREVRRYLTANQLQPIPVQAVPLAHVLTDRARANHGTASTTVLAPLRNKRFVLSVSTVEARKNHGYLVTAWRLMLEEGLDPPDLVFVGRHGWRVRDFMEQLTATNMMDGRVHLLHDLSDTELGALYANCLFTAFPSFVEGWGLPVGESLVHGQPCIASGSSSIPEVGGDLVDYVDPYNVRDGVTVLRRMMFDDSYREGRRAEIRARFKPRTWEAVAADLLAAIGELRPSTAQPWTRPLLRSGEVFRPGDYRTGQPVMKSYSRRPLRLIIGGSWYSAEKFGMWLRGRKATLRFKTDCMPGTEIIVYVQLVAAPRSSGLKLDVSFGDVDLVGTADPEALSTTLAPVAQAELEENTRLLLRVIGRTDADSVAAVTIAVAGQVSTVSDTDRRRLSIGLRAVAYGARDDVVRRTDILEALQTTPS